ncbi:MAG: proline--tRNA ligase [Phycisphaerae bacterium]|nr:proline--tRNA ligase [Phycisphaerae bacterium]NUQ46222.1 proline--tRNA ligase [Phycisphaerae bacterium]
MRWTEFFIPTTKEVPKDAVVASHQLMLRAGLIRQLAAGVYAYLPLGYRALRKIENIVREEMNSAGAIELHMPCLQPLELWEQTGRTQAMGDVLLRLAGPAGDWRTQTCLGPTHEENVTEIVKAYVSSYKQLPINLYQIQTKFRGEARPKSGVLRTREFLMKDAYSFDRDKAGLDVSYQKMYDAYCRIYTRCGLPYIAVEAESGPIGGDASHEFMVLTEAGEDYVAMSENGDYAANTERATCAPPRISAAPLTGSGAALSEIHTPGAGRVEDVCKLLGTTPAHMIKTLIYRTATVEATSHRKGAASGPPARVIALVRGDHDINDHKLAKISGLRLELADPRTIEELTGAAVGFAGPQGLFDRLRPGEQLIIDRDVEVMTSAATGANRTDYHVDGVVPGRDFPLESRGESGAAVKVADIRNVVDGDASPTGSGSPLRLRKAIEVGHVFKLGTKYTAKDSLDATFLDADGKPKPFIMGCYGIGLNRIMAAAIESRHDDGGIIWPMSIAPFEALIVALDPRDAQVMSTAAKIHDELAAAGVDVLYDDRDERAGFKFKDADLIGIPLRIVVGRKSLAEGVVEMGRRAGGEAVKLPPSEAVGRATALVRELRG